MVRRYDEPVEVWRRDDEPQRFCWRGRTYVINGVLSHWVEAGGWWVAPAAESVLDDGEREVWRVEAVSRGGPGVYELCFSWPTGAWRLLRTLD